MNDVYVAIFAFASTRYLLPKVILKQKITLKEMIVLSLCYGLCAHVRKIMSKKDNGNTN